MAAPRDPSYRRQLVLVALLAAVILLLSARSQIYDTNFYFLWEAVSILAGDNTYRDVYDMGSPLVAYLSAGAQLLVGYRLIGEFLTQWTFIVVGVVIAFYLGLRVSRSAAVVWATFPVVLILLAYTPTYHYPKLFFLPLTIWLGWCYLEQPGADRSALFGLMAAIAFLFRHDYGVYVGFASVAALALASLTRPARPLMAVLGDSAAYLASAAVVIVPWAVIVHRHEGLLEYVQVRAALYENPERGFVYLTLLQLDPVAAIRTWLQAPGSPAAAASAISWLQQIVLLVPILLLAAGGIGLWRVRARPDAPREGACRLLLAGAFLVVVDAALLQEPAYLTVVAPVTAALGARFLEGTASLQRACAVGVLLCAGVTAILWTRESALFRPSDFARSVGRAFEVLLASPPVSLSTPLDGNPTLSLRYLHECTTPDDRILVTGSTPYQVAYYAQRPIAGGQLYWRHQWRSDSRHEAQSLALLEQQSVPFAFSTDEPVLKDFEHYPRIRQYLTEHYVDLEGSNGRVLIDRRRQPTGTFGSLRFPCFR
jgi:4-amino-4-deoxy-L-arabinose transferase-like glycosyltransferase